MAKKANPNRKDNQPGSSEKAAPRGKEESISGYFRNILKNERRLLKSRSNKALLDRWLADHPGYETVPERVRQNLSNVKSVLRKKRRRRKAIRDQEAQATATGPVRQARKGSRMEGLEEQIDDCLTLAKNLDREGLGDVIHLLRRARNEVVWKMGQSE